MRLLRALSAALLLIVSLGFAIGEAEPARAQSVEDAEQNAADARQDARQAESILSDAANGRAGIEDELAASLTRLTELNAELTRVAIHLDGLRKALSVADQDLETLDQDLNTSAIDAYVRAVAAPATAVFGSGSTESAIVASNSIQTAIDSDHSAVADLTIKRRQLEELRSQYLADEEQLAGLQAEVDAETAHLEGLLAEADAELAEASAAARATDENYRRSLSAVDAARAREAERQREAAQAATTTAPTPTTAPDPGSTTSTAPPENTTQPPPPPDPSGPFPPAVERWRPLVSAYFPSAMADQALSVMQCESNGDPNAYNPYSGTSGLFQFLPSTWATTSPRAGFSGASAFDPEANIGTAAWLVNYYASKGSQPWAAWFCRP